MLIERIPEWLRKLAKDAVFMIPQREGEKKVYLTFDDGPIPEVIPERNGLLPAVSIIASPGAFSVTIPGRGGPFYFFRLVV